MNIRRKHMPNLQHWIGKIYDVHASMFPWQVSSLSEPMNPIILIRRSNHVSYKLEYQSLLQRQRCCLFVNSQVEASIRRMSGNSVEGALVLRVDMCNDIRLPWDKHQHRASSVFIIYVWYSYLSHNRRHCVWKLRVTSAHTIQIAEYETLQLTCLIAGCGFGSQYTHPGVSVISCLTFRLQPTSRRTWVMRGHRMVNVDWRNWLMQSAKSCPWSIALDF